MNKKYFEITGNEITKKDYDIFKKLYENNYSKNIIIFSMILAENEFQFFKKEYHKQNKM